MQRLSSRVCAVSRHGHQVWVHSLRSTRTRWRLPEEILPTMVTDGSPRGWWHSISAHNCRSLTAGICSLPWGFPYVLQMVDTWMKDLHVYYGPAWERTRDKDVRKHYAQLVNEFNYTKRVCVWERDKERKERQKAQHGDGYWWRMAVWDSWSCSCKPVQAALHNAGNWTCAPARVHQVFMQGHVILSMPGSRAALERGESRFSRQTKSFAGS